MFRAAIELSRLAENHLRGDNTLSPEDRVNLKFYVAMYVAALAAGVAKPTPEQVRALAGATIDEALVKKAVADVRVVYDGLGGTAIVAKGSELGQKLIAQLAAFKMGKDGKT